MNQIEATEEVRQLYVEAFCFAVIFNSLRTQEFPIYEEFISTIEDLYSLNLGIEFDERFLRAQGVLFMSMKNNQVLMELLLHEWAERTSSLGHN